ncbi:hypothetical protein KFK09_029058 [Dendrobium nobile]|uniref:Uncharacterized protein n=1 Tax=Dendrobium nobile TaxID=94219 RepID=A0A8T3A4F4_DENNO|nr:hypothetical protein KFK09_029058 [Dendrobium nobile]
MFVLSYSSFSIILSSYMQFLPWDNLDILPCSCLCRGCICQPSELIKAMRVA